MSGTKGIELARKMAVKESRSRAGFTLVEMVFTIAVIGILAGIAYPKINFVQYAMDSGARITHGALQRGHRLAITRQYDVVVSFDLTRNTIRILEDENNSSSADVNERIAWKPLEENARFATPPTGINGSVLSPVVGSNLATVDGMPSIIFRRSGAASTDAEVYIASPRGDYNDFRGVTLIQSTGRADWYRYLNSAWKAGGL